MTVAKAAGVVIAQSKRNPGRPAAGLRPNADSGLLEVASFAAMAAADRPCYARLRRAQRPVQGSFIRRLESRLSGRPVATADATREVNDQYVGRVLFANAQTLLGRDG
jgi:hypothetical protein